MQEIQLRRLITKILGRKTETANIEFKSAKEGSPEKLYDTFFLQTLTFKPKSKNQQIVTRLP